MYITEVIPEMTTTTEKLMLIQYFMMDYKLIKKCLSTILCMINTTRGVGLIMW